MKKKYTLRRSIQLLSILILLLLSFACSDQPNSQDDPSSPFSNLSKDERIKKGLELKSQINGAKFLLEYYKQMPTSEEALTAFSGTDFRQLAYLWEYDTNYFPKILAEISIFETALKDVAATSDKTVALPNVQQRDNKLSLVANLALTQLKAQERMFLSSYNYRIIKAAFQEPHFIKVKDGDLGDVLSAAELNNLNNTYIVNAAALREEARKTPAIQLKALQTRNEVYWSKSKSIADQLLKIVSSPEQNNLKPIQGEQFEAYVKRVNSHTPQVRNKYYKISETPDEIQTRFSSENLSETASRYLAEQSRGMPEIRRQVRNNPPKAWSEPLLPDDYRLNYSRANLSKNPDIGSFVNKITEPEKPEVSRKPEVEVTDSGNGNPSNTKQESNTNSTIERLAQAERIRQNQKGNSDAPTNTRTGLQNGRRNTGSHNRIRRGR